MPIVSATIDGNGVTYFCLGCGVRSARPDNPECTCTLRSPPALYHAEERFEQAALDQYVSVVRPLPGSSIPANALSNFVSGARWEVRQ